MVARFPERLWSWPRRAGMCRAHQVAIVPLSQLTMASSRSRLPSLQEAAVFLALQQGNQVLQHGVAVANETDLHWVSQPNALRVDIDLYPAGLARLRHELDIGERRSHHQQGVAVFDRFLRRPGAEQ